jgi:hypothetical protein
VEADVVATLTEADEDLLLGRLGVATFKATGTATSDSTDGVRVKHGIEVLQKEVSTIAEVPSDVFRDVLHPRVGVVSLPNDRLVWRMGVVSL